MDWARAIERNSEALKTIVAALYAMLGFAGDAALARMRIPRGLHTGALRVLRPAESALRRLIVIAARGLVVKLPPSRPMPAGFTLAGKGGARSPFRLFDRRKRFAPSCRGRGSKAEPRLHIFGASPLAPLFQPAPAARSTPEPDGTVSAGRLCRRLAALKLALDDLPRQAKRLARWRLRRERLPNAKFTSPLRPGRPPGHRRRPVHDVDRVLAECHGL